ncbi:Putative NAD(P)H nitroreductase ydjA [Delftia tsuruhatensis]|uniref:nitroreductase family protein n=1 Tax=Delftia tsuruhatensis TaxID=180282 RepID=UPI001E6A7F29|nr:nitroreductase [Delftia tsuruhatensis]CAB5669054.1 Putative NAD(P)H nitroreductase ydjA [Delftia tsuruhatensis]CAC9682719.1 Putative NAD(P)H nitroreductase ydjA [Delftia tsuruhatensis]
MNTDDTSLSPQQHAALELLMSRQSRWPLEEPAPGPGVIDLVIDAALRAPDHGQLRPWRFVVVQGDARHALGEVFAQAAMARDPEADAERFRAKALSAPLIIALGVHLQPGHKVPQSEQLLAGGAAAMNMLNALHILGFGGFWASGANSHDAQVREALGFEPQDRLVGLLYVGTPGAASRAALRPPRNRFVREWQPSGPWTAPAR